MIGGDDGNLSKLRPATTEKNTYDHTKDGALFEKLII